MPTGADPAGYNPIIQDGTIFGDGSAIGGGLSALLGRTQDAVTAAKKTELAGNPHVTGTLGGIFDGLDPTLPLPVALLKGLLTKLVPGLDLSGLSGMPSLLALIEEVPVLGDVVQWITGTSGPGSAIQAWSASLQSNLTNAASDAASAVGKFASLLSGMGLSSIGGLITSLLGTSSTASSANTNASSALGQFTSLWNNLVDGVSGATGSTGKTLTDALAALQAQFGQIVSAGTSASSALGGLGTLQTALTALQPSALTALEKSILATLALGQRTNKSAAMGANPTSQASFTLGHFSNPATGTQTTSALATGNAIAQRYTVPEIATNGFVEFQLSIPSGTNAVYINILKIDTATNAKTALANSANIAGGIGTSITHVRTLLPAFPTVHPGDELLLEVVNASASNALTVVTKTTGAPNNTNEIVQNVGFSRSTSAGGNSPTSLTAAQGSYTGTVPYAVIGIANVPADYHPPAKDDYTSVASSGSETMPSWLDNGDFIDVQGIGGGGGGGSSLFGLEGQGGGAATWGTQRLVVGTDIKKGSSYSWGVGGRGAAGNPSSGGRGGDTTFTYVDPANASHTITFTGGAYGVRSGNTVDPTSTVGNDATGQGAGTQMVDGTTYYGGASVGAGSTGQSPGGGGGGALPYFNGASGGVGQLSLYRAQA